MNHTTLRPVTSLDDARRKRTRCPHANLAIDAKRHELECVDCGNLVDPFVVLLQYSEAYRKFEYKFEEHNKIIKSVGARVDRLIKQERNVRARLRRLGVLPEDMTESKLTEALFYMQQTYLQDPLWMTCYQEQGEDP